MPIEPTSSPGEYVCTKKIKNCDVVSLPTFHPQEKNENHKITNIILYYQSLNHTQVIEPSQRATMAGPSRETSTASIAMAKTTMTTTMKTTTTTTVPSTSSRTLAPSTTTTTMKTTTETTTLPPSLLTSTGSKIPHEQSSYQSSIVSIITASAIIIAIIIIVALVSVCKRFRIANTPMTNPDIEMMTLDNSDADDDKKNDETDNHEQNDNQINIIFNPSYQPPDNHLNQQNHHSPSNTRPKQFIRRSGRMNKGIPPKRFPCLK